MNPAQVKKSIETRLRDYARQSIPIEKAHPEATNKLLEFFANPKTALLQDPYLELLPRYQHGETLAELRDQRLIDPLTAEIFADYFDQPGHPERIKLHSHQADAIRQVCRHGQEFENGVRGDGNLVVCSGTGSGKTESFLIPVIDHLVREWRSETGENRQTPLGSGVRAMILYPMNALVNDQLSRIRKMLKGYPFLTFGRYTGETEQDSEISSGVEENLTQINQAFLDAMLPEGGNIDGVVRNEVVTRQQWRTAPAHILITNYSMLEYLLIRPEMNSLFSTSWKHIVLDEAHSYDGAMGAEIGWLMRRLQSRLPSQENLRFIATSATLINRPGLSDDEKEQEIRSDFASKIFPANPESFRVLFGTERHADAGNTPRNPGFYGELSELPLSEAVSKSVQQALDDVPLQVIGNNEDWKRLLDLSISAKGAAAWCKKTLSVLGALPSPNNTLALSDALELLRTGLSVVASHPRLAPAAINREPLENGFFTGVESDESFKALAYLLFYGIGGFCETDAWRKWMHDDADPRPSALDNDNDDRGKRQRIGNKLHFLWKEWIPAFGADIGTGDFDPQNVLQQNLSCLSLDGSFWLLDLAHELSVSIDQELNQGGLELHPERLKVRLSTDAYQSLSQLRSWFETLQKRIDAAETALGKAWYSAYPDLPLAALEKPSEILERWLSADNSLHELQSRLRTALKQAEAANDARWNSLREHIFPDQRITQDEKDKELAALVRVASFAQKRGSREPLLDLRYHQLFRGLHGAGLQLTPGQGGVIQDWAVVEKTEETGELGACRSCGQAFILGYAKERRVIVPGQDVQLLRFAGGDYQHLWALAWKRGAREDDESEEERKPDEEDLWFHPKDYIVRRSPIFPGAGWNKVVWWEVPSDPQYPWFLTECPNCRETRAINIASVTRQSFGLITPYSLTSILRVAALEELSRQADPSPDPVARLLPGQGRKLIAFSDSRSGAARLSLGFQNFWVEAALAKLLPEVVAESADPQKTARWCREHQHRNTYLTPEQQRILPREMQLGIINNLLERTLGDPDFEAFCCILAGKLEENQAGRVLEISGQNFEDLDPKWAAGVLILEALRRVGRNSTMVRGGLGLGLCGFNYLHADFRNLFGANQVSELLSAALFNLYKKAKVIIPKETLWISDEINRFTEWGAGRVFIAKNGAGQGGMSFVTNETGSFNKLISRALLQTVAWEEPVRQFLEFEDPTRHPVVVALCRSAAVLNLDDLRTIVTAARFVAQNDDLGWEHQMNAVGIPVREGEKTKRQAFKNLLRSKVSQLVQTILENFWRQLVPPPGNPAQTGLTPEQGVGRYLLNPEPLKLIQLNVAEGGDPAPYELEYRNQCDRDLIFVRAEEHTAQLSSRAGTAYQRAFTNGSINLLSCSTTFEMGVDLGDLSIVFLANLPPSPSNYRQRAGRAGRRPGSPAYVMTYFSDALHDQYYWNRPSELFFGTLKAPVIHLDNPVIRARHLRAEALHYFLRDNGLAAGPHRVAVTLPGNEGTTNRSRGWQTLQDFLIGEVSGGVIRRDHALFDSNQRGAVHYKGRMASSLVDEFLQQWLQQNGEKLQSHIVSIRDVPNDLGYEVASDFVWQLTGGDCSPYQLSRENLPKFQQLGGPHVPEFDEQGKPLSDAGRRWRWMPLKHQAELIFRNRSANGYYPTTPGQARLTAFQRHFLKERTLEWLAANRVLPKYGFPVDVVELRTKRNDPYARRIEFERDLKIALYEYAPQEQVVADKRIYTSIGPGNYHANNVETRPVLSAEEFCESCNELFQGAVALGNCPNCNSALRRENFCNPDYFKADRSVSGRTRQKPPSAKDHLFTGGIHNERHVKETLLVTAESRTGFITFLNRGPSNQGYSDPGGTMYTLRHEVRTDIALWLLREEFFQHFNHWHQIVGTIGARDYSRFEAAMKSALQAILIGIMRSKRLRGGDVEGLVSPDPRNRQQSGRYGFVFYDNSSGGAGSVQDLVLTGTLLNDSLREIRIKEVISEAIKVCKCACDSGLNLGKDPELTPNTREDYLAADNQANLRVRVACYSCLKSYGNQRDHLLLDRHDASYILERIFLNVHAPDWQGTQFRSDSIVPCARVHAEVRTNDGKHEGYFMILPWTIEGVRQGIKVKKLDPPEPEISISNSDLDAGVVSVTIFFNP
jgi:hypothetical protein